jgi:conjugal transfer pilus assembly protein TraE
MNINQAAKELEFRTGIKKIVFVLLGTSIFANALLGMMAIANKNTHRETLTPPSIQKSFWVDGENVSPEYLEQMGKFILELAVNNTPLNCETNRSALLKYTGSGSYGAISAQTAANCRIIEKSRLSNFFAVSTISIKSTERAIVFTGSMTRWLNDKRMPDRAGAYRIKLGYSGGRIYLSEIVEVDPKIADQFGDAAVKKDVLEQMQAEMAAGSLSENESIVSNTSNSDEAKKVPQ